VPLVALAGVLALVALLAYGVASKREDTSIDTQLAAGKRPAAPAVSLPKLDGGGSVPLSSYRGKVVVLNFWASWCDPCKDEAPVLNEIARRYDGRAEVIGVDTRDVAGLGRDFAKRYGLTFPLLHDDGSQYRRWGLTGLPETFVIDREGRVVHHFIQQLTGSELRAELDPLVGAGS
jgi:cytochrome c biogenesis protein CcmG/thiol:disulfide interchange protein DsbE